MLTRLNFILFLFIVFAKSAPCQDVRSFDASSPNNDTIRYVNLNSRLYMKDRKLNFAESKAYLTRYESSAKYFQKFQRNSIISTVFLCTGITSGIIALTRLKKDKNFFTPYTITIYSSLAIGIPFSLSATKNLKKSVRNYNKAVQL